ncbi:DUF1027 domain-containing protein [Paenibacillus sp. CAA11]|uniref:YutD family protein n=1 Tax=Paenibacillus sp. CAA11 TaxID=1532905 RepID=UPI000D35A618|nr:YutD family protein [Paenibacillus sp. CAA11]AWB45912.1 DUF1027 domain-containing protein [Paenibacillus sp. CAA11]
MIQVNGKHYEVVKDYKNGWNPEAFKQRYSDVLERYDYIIGDWGYNQLRLKGFYKDTHPKATRDTAVSGITDYINEYCNFGCAYFVLQKVKEASSKETDKESGGKTVQQDQSKNPASADPARESGPRKNQGKEGQGKEALVKEPVRDQDKNMSKERPASVNTEDAKVSEKNKTVPE